MGVRGLMTYMCGDPNFLENYELCSSYIVIDGLALAPHLFFRTECNCAFGGDLDRYANSVNNFFNQLRECEVIPLVIMDGGVENRKAETLANRSESCLQAIINYTPASQATSMIAPMCFEMVFVSVLRQRGVKIVRCPFEADSSCAAVAQILNCPVLSRDSDFYIFGVNYISTDTLLPFIAKSSWGRKYVKPCKIFKPQYLLRSFPGMDLSVLPLVAVLLGNDYVKRETFKKFFDALKLSDQTKRLYCIEQRRIDATLRYLRNYNLNDAVAAVLGEIPKKSRRKVLNIIEEALDGYMNLPCEILLPLGFAKQYHAEMKRRGERKRFKFHGDISTLNSTLSWRASQSAVASEDSSSEEETKEETSTSMSDLVDYPGRCYDVFVKSWPSWFAHRFSIADFPAYFVDLMFHRSYTVPVHIENYNYPSAYEMSLKLLGVIDGLLVAGREESATGLLYIIRDGKEYVERSVDTVRGTRSTIFPALRDLNDTPMSTKEQIFYDTLEITGKKQLIEDIPSQWRLYIAAALYWMQQADQPSRNWLHMRAILFTMLLGVIDRKIGHCRSFDLFNKRYEKILEKIEFKRESVGPEIPDMKNESITEALKIVTPADCVLAARFFISICQMDQQLCECPEKFNVTIVHVFAQFQSCLKYAMDLNSLLGFIYESPLIEELYNGTMFYNLYSSFEQSSDVDSYITGILEKSPSLLRLLNLLTAKVNEMLTAPIDGKTDKAAA